MSSTTTERSIPGVLWIAVVILGVSGLILLSLALARSNGRHLLAGLVCFALVVGLCLGHRWAYVLAVFFHGPLTLIVIVLNPRGMLSVLLINLPVLVSVLLSTSYFFGTQKPRALVNPLVCPRCGYTLLGLTVPRCPECGQQFDIPM